MKKIVFFSLALVALAFAVNSCKDKEEVKEDDVATAEVAAKELGIDKELTIYVDSTYQFKAEVTPKDATGKINWSSSNTDVVTVDANGLMKALKKGTAIVTANIGNVIAACNVTVRNNPVTLELEMMNIIQRKCTVAVKPSDEEGYYYCGYATPSDLANISDEKLAQTMVEYMKSILAQYAQMGYNYTLDQMLQKGKKNLIASGLTANTEYVMFAFGVDVETETAGKVVTRLPFKTKEVVPSSMTFTIAFDSIAKIKAKDETFTYNGYFKCTPSNETEKFVFTGVKSIVLDTAYNNDAMAYLTAMEAYYDQNYSSYGGFEGEALGIVKAGERDVYFKTMEHNVKYTLIAAGYDGGFSTKATTFEYTFQHPDSVKAEMPVRINNNSRVVPATEIVPVENMHLLFLKGMCH